MKKISVVILAIFFYTSFAYANSSSSDKLQIQELKNHVTNLIDDSYKTFNDQNLSDVDIIIASRRLLKSHLYLNWMAKYSLGHHRRLMPQNKIDDFVRIYSMFIVNSYTELLSRYSGEKASVKTVRQIDDDLFIVNLEVIKPNAQFSIKIDYLVHKIYINNNNHYLIGDIITEGISMLNTQKSEFNSIISTRGIDALIADLQSRLQH